MSSHDASGGSTTFRARGCALRIVTAHLLAKKCVICDEVAGRQHHLALPAAPAAALCASPQQHIVQPGSVYLVLTKLSGSTACRARDCALSFTSSKSSNLGGTLSQLYISGGIGGR